VICVPLNLLTGGSGISLGVFGFGLMGVLQRDEYGLVAPKNLPINAHSAGVYRINGC
jgi:hypothetical protein